MLLERTSVEEAQRVACAFASLRPINPVFISADTQRSQTDTGSGDAGDVLVTGRQS